MAKIHYQIHFLASFLILLILITQPINLHLYSSIQNSVDPVSSSQNVRPAPADVPITSPGPDLAISNWTHNHIENPGFENWNDSNSPLFWSHSNVIQSMTAHSGEYSCNLTGTSTGPYSTSYLNQSPFIRVSYHNPGNISLWWHLNIEQLSANDYALIQFQMYNFTHNFRLNYILSSGSSLPFTNTSLELYYHVNGFNSTGSWHRFQFNLLDAIATPFNTTEAVVTTFNATVQTQNPNSHIQVLLDDLRFDARAISDADYEDQLGHGEPIQGWNTDISPHFTATTIYGNGAVGAQCQLESSEDVKLSHDLNQRPLNSTRETYLDVIWLLLEFSTGRIQYSVKLSDNRSLHYVFAANNWTELKNDATNAFFNASNAGTIGYWNQMHCDLVHDYENAFGSLPNCSMISLQFLAFSDSDLLEIIFDDLYLYDDPAPRLSNYDSWRAGISETRKIFVDAEDQDLETVSVMFRTNGGNWIELTMLPSTYYPYIENRYETTTPERPYNTLVEYYIQARDSWDGISQLLNGSGYFYYRVQDTHVPEVEILWPSHETIVHGLVEIRVSATDTEGGVDYVEFRIDGESHYNDTTAPYSYTWNSTTVPDGRHRFSAIAHDYRGNSAGRSRYVYTINNPDPPPPPFPFAIIVISVLIICTQIILLGYLVYRRKQRK